MVGFWPGSTVAATRSSLFPFLSLFCSVLASILFVAWFGGDDDGCWYGGFDDVDEDELCGYGDLVMVLSRLFSSSH
ncbi:hypothetical protein A2U01_0054364 [Trifolium medium]|uniref:Uncharacterized protein n=1 Tax=Trifolium medium TaxID=97028 RepID=A0A392R940_9FABA|nr:hypothetical protein [Trifolium medium]